MELLDVRLSALQRRNRAAFVSRTDLAGDPALVPGQRVVLRDADGEYFSGSVVDSHGDAGAERYLIHVGVRLPEEQALQRVGRIPQPRTAADDDMQSLLDLLGDAREALGGVLPSQRRGG